MPNKHFLLHALAVGIVLASCAKKEVVPTFDIAAPPVAPPPVYVKDKHDIGADTNIIKMFDLMAEYNEGGNNTGYVLDSVKLKNMLYNTNAPFYIKELNNTPVNLAQKVNPTHFSRILGLFKQISAISRVSSQAASNGVAGLLQDGSTTKLADQNGYVLHELIEKELMGSFQLYQVCHVQLSPAALSTGDTARVRNWDKAFAYLGLTDDYANYKNTYPGLRFWGHYLIHNDAALGGNVDKLLNAFVKGREAVKQKDNAAVLLHAQTVRVELEKAAAGMALSYLVDAREYQAAGANGSKIRALTEAYGFLSMLPELPSPKISDSQYSQLASKLNESLWIVSATDIDFLISEFSKIYGFEPSRF